MTNHRPGAFAHDVRRGMLWLAIGIFAISLQDPIIKAIMDGYPVSEAVIIRSLAALPIFAFLLWRSGAFRDLVRAEPGPLILRAGLFMVSYTLYFIAFPAMPLANVVALYFTAPLFVVALSPIVIGERQSRGRWIAVLIGFAGALVIAQPGVDGGVGLAALLPLGSAALYATGQLIARRVGSAAPATVMSTHQNSVFLLGAGIFAFVASPWAMPAGADGPAGFLLRAWEIPTAPDLLLLALCGPIAVVGTTFLTKAYRDAPPGAVTTIEYTLLLWAALWGFLFFAEIPTIATLLGAVLIVASGAYAMTRAVAPTTPEAQPSIS